MGLWQGQRLGRKCQKKMSLGKQQAGTTREGSAKCWENAEEKHAERELGTGEMTELHTPLIQAVESSQVSG